MGNERFRTLNRVELIYDGYEVTAPSANVGYSKDLFVKLGGFDAPDVEIYVFSGDKQLVKTTQFNK